MITFLLVFLAACLISAGAAAGLLVVVRAALNWVTRNFTVVAWNNHLPHPGYPAPAWSWA